MLIRIALGLLSLFLAGLYALWLDVAQPDEIRSAARLAGERWYRLLMEGSHIGYVHTRSWRDARGDWRFETFTHFSLNGEAPVSISDRLEFQAAPPYALTAAEHWSHRGESDPEGIVVESGDDGTTSMFVRGAESDSRSADWQYGLRDYLGLEVWLARERPLAGNRFSARLFDFDRGEPVSRTFRIVEENEIGYLVESPAPLRATTIQLNRRLAPVELSMAGIFIARRATRSDALLLSTAVTLNSEQLRPIYDWFSSNLFITGLGDWENDFSVEWCRSNRRAELIQFLRAADLAIDDI
ncbi:MAG: hypothetical protein OXE40_14815, partial [Gammaproteobacteria bacterium]|nr:hypothetical protein [Gammaproteobacteria bacterium]